LPKTRAATEEKRPFRLREKQRRKKSYRDLEDDLRSATKNKGPNVSKKDLPGAKKKKKDLEEGNQGG